jgi:hypothetical protein
MATSPKNLEAAAEASFNSTNAAPEKEECLKVCPKCNANLQEKPVTPVTPVTPGEMAPSPVSPQNSLGPESSTETPKGLYNRVKSFFGLGGRRRRTHARRHRHRKGTRKHRRSAGSRKH